VEQDRHMQYIIEKGKQSNGSRYLRRTVRENALLFRLGYFDQEKKAV